MPEMFGGGVGLFDFDRDGDLDILAICGGEVSASRVFSGLPPRLYRNQGNWQFEEATAEVGLNHPIDYSHGCTVGDFNRDGYPDLWISCYGCSRLFRNDRGQKFVDVTESAGVTIQDWSTSATFADINNDGWPDLYVTTYLNWKPDPSELCRDPHSGRRDVCMPGDFPGTRDHLFLNQKDGTFVDIAESAGLKEDGKELGVIAGDFNRDGMIDFYVANDVIANFLYIGMGNNQFQEQAILAGAAGNEYGIAEGSMGLDYGDYDGDGQGDIFVTNYELEENSLYHNDGQGLFSHSTVAAGLAGRSRPHVGWATGFADFDSDGWLDLFIVNGHVVYHNRQSAFRQPAILFRNLGNRRFEDRSDQGGPWFSVPHNARGAAVGDLDNDGAVDMVVSLLDEPIVLLKNRRPVENWVQLELRGTTHDLDAIGASAQISVGHQTMTRFVRGGGGYASYFDPRLHFAFGSEESKTIDAFVTWPGGTQELFTAIPTKRIHKIVEGTGRAIAGSATMPQ